MRSPTSVYDSIWLSVSPFVRMIKPKRLKLKLQNLARYLAHPFNIRSKGQTSRSQGHKAQNHIQGGGVTGVIYALCQVAGL